MSNGDNNLSIDNIIACMVGTAQLLDEQPRVVKFTNKKPYFQRLSESIYWNHFAYCSTIDMCKSEETTLVVTGLIPPDFLKNATRTAFYFERKLSSSLALDETDNQLNDRRSFRESVGLGAINHTTHATGFLFDRQSLLRSNSNGTAVKTKRDKENPILEN